jgi:hypothetical protein
LSQLPHSSSNHRFGGPTRIDCRVLIPCRREPIRSKRSRHGSADHPAEEATACAPQHAASHVGDEFVKHLSGFDTIVEKRAGQARAQLGQCCRSSNRRVFKISEIRQRVGQGTLKDRAIR